MEVRFAPQYIGDDSKRKRHSKACDECKRRKRRCIHTEFVADVIDTAGISTISSSGSIIEISSDALNPNHDGGIHKPGRTTAVPSNSHSNGHVLSNSNNTDTTHDAPTPQLFVGDLNPEAALADHFSASSSEEGPTSFRNDIGVWIGNDHTSAANQNHPDSADASTPVIPHALEQIDGQVLFHGFDQRRLLLDTTNQDALVNIYFTRIHPILPIVDEGAFKRDYRVGKVWDGLLKAMSLVAAKDKLAVPYLRLHKAIVPLHRFTRLLFRDVTSKLSTTSGLDRLTLIRTYTLLSLHNEGSNGAEKANLHLMHAIHYAVSIGLHLERREISQDSESKKKLFWCLWSLDKLSACINGGPIKINERDVGVSKCDFYSSEDKPFAMWMELASMLSDVIAFYRPSAPASSTGWEDDFPSFETILARFDGLSMPLDFVRTLHCLYLIVAILSSRTRSTNVDHVSTHSFTRRNLAALHMISLVSKDSMDDLLPLHIIPYGVSLALAVSYQNMRQSQLSYLQDRAMSEFKACLEILQRLSQEWRSAEVMMALATKILDTLDKKSSMGPVRVPIMSAAQFSPSHRSPHRVYQHHDATNDPPTSQDVIINDQQLRNTNEHTGKVQPISQTEDEIGTLENFLDMDHFFESYLDPNDPGTFDDLF